jgi:hypothetical protein
MGAALMTREPFTMPAGYDEWKTRTPDGYDMTPYEELESDYRHLDAKNDRLVGLLDECGAFLFDLHQLTEFKDTELGGLIERVLKELAK